ncbi:hypothetical protein [Bradyrhizobium sp. Leo121]|uniref:hypothetical protein n=1 Tax=Bradyrhizobium sp. Leo121 TaxID=1571195 RepID=UPI0010292E36|nr:hypothetical protein [Bradyrhizobium sp. Leo121]RZN33902.1 hypothetical protein CWO90_08710 [Bradyrhizobium sp. Leo121]
MVQPHYFPDNRASVFRIVAEFLSQSNPDADGNIPVFPIIEHDVVVGEKYRGPDKSFFQKRGGKRTFINGDVLDEPTPENGGQHDAGKPV